MYRICHWEKYESKFITNVVAAPLGACLHIQFTVFL